MDQAAEELGPRGIILAILCMKFPMLIHFLLLGVLIVVMETVQQSSKV